MDHPEVVADGGIKPDYITSFDPEIEGIFALGGISDRTLCSSKNDSQTFFDRNIHLSAKQRWALTQTPLYRPKNLESYQQWLDAFTTPELTHEGSAEIAVENASPRSLLSIQQSTPLAS